ncbi:CaiB/BaiF CoA transferase family protein [Amycolatopsis jejuensis]|uniref:CaiB/BaiF CoA transferase family protein n=1 Tax=Amycolatopsis jejuensis TaxID=330084 RepID=UPI0007C592D8|nr:CoA transferase [Amycolatopsis jejuensis]
MPDPAGPLAGVRVLDFSTTFSGPYATHLLAELGADVLKVEAPHGDVTRALGTATAPGIGSVYAGANRNKASVVLDLKDPAGRETAHALVARADCLVHNMRPAAAARLRIDAATATEINPRLVYASITGYGSDGPYADRPAYDDVIQAMSGLAWLQGLNEPEPGYVATPIADKVAGLMLSHAVLAALYWRAQSGRGQCIEVPMYETMVGFTLLEQWGGRAVTPPAGPTGYARLRSAHRRPYRTADGMISVVVYHDGHWSRFLAAVGRAELLSDPRYRTAEARNHHIGDLYEMLAGLLPQRTTEDWLELFAGIDVPAVPVKSLDEVFDDRHLAEVGFFQEVRGESGTRYLAARPAVRFSGSPAPDPRDLPGPSALGAATAARWLEPRTP